MLGLLKTIRLGGDVLVLFHERGTEGRLGGLASRGGRDGDGLLEVVQDYLL